MFLFGVGFFFSPGAEHFLVKNLVGFLRNIFFRIMTTATLARGPPMGVGGAMKIEDDEDALMEGTDEEENVQQSSRLLSSSKSNGRISHGRGFGSARGIRTNHALHIEETEADEEGDGERNSEERENEEYNNGLVMDYSAGNGNGGNKRCSSASDGEGDHDTGQDTEMTNEEDADPNGSIQVRRLIVNNLAAHFSSILPCYLFFV